VAETGDKVRPTADTVDADPLVTHGADDHLTLLIAVPFERPSRKVTCLLGQSGIGRFN
jgi:hypothetical protein